MAMEIFALSDRRLNSIAEWQRAIDDEGFPFPPRLSADVLVGQLSGFLPARYDGVLVQAADAAMYRVKDRGKNGIQAAVSDR